ncbi:MAG TPA: hypothetical protein VFQ73_16015 [Flavisolibacter sp.]|nr:hypothetical protein [Flavisolibacter sp.]
MKTETIEILEKNRVIKERKNKEAAGNCCGGAPAANEDACCKLDEDKKAEGGAGCGCQSQAAVSGAGCC